jgi:hypothetical protein
MAFGVTPGREGQGHAATPSARLSRLERELHYAAGTWRLRKDDGCCRNGANQPKMIALCKDWQKALCRDLI